MRQRIIYYRDEVNDDFAGTNIKTKPLRENYRYIRESAVWKTASFVLYRVIAQPLVFLFVKTVYRQRFENKEVLKETLMEKYSDLYVVYRDASHDKDEEESAFY